MNGLLRAMIAAGALALGTSVLAQAFPSKVVKIVVAYAPGGATDVVTRAVAQRLSPMWGQPVIIENKPGANTNIAAAEVAKAPADSTTLSAKPHKAGQLKVLAVGSSKRLAAFPDVPTIAESGLPGYEAVTWFGLFAPAGTPREVVGKINADVQRVLAGAEFREKFLAPNFFEPIAGSPEQFGDYVKREAEKWAKVIRAAKITVD